jgi:hypothetical protein
MPMSSLLESNQDVWSAIHEYPNADLLTTTILGHLDEQTVISLDSLVSLMPQYSWNQIFYTVDQLTRRSMIVLRRHRFEYMLFSANFVA